MLHVTHNLVIPRSELSFRTSRSSGPGGQHVNKVETRVELLFDLAHSPVLTDAQRLRLAHALSNWLDSGGVLHLVVDRFRSQYANREEAVARFVHMLREALRPRKTRKATTVPRAVREERLHQKKRRATVKRLRSRRADE